MRECKADQFEGCDIVFSGLDSDVAGDIGEHAIHGCYVLLSLG